MRKFYSLLLVLLFGISTSIQAVNYCATTSWGYCGTNVTGGGNATPTLVTNESQLATALGKGNVVIIITQDITVTNHISSSKSNMTIMALPGKKLISTQQNSSNSGILYLKGNNLILRNLTFVGPGAYDCDGWDNLCFDKATNCWVDHCDFQDGCDGNFDNKGTTDNITISWCRFRYLKEPRAGGSGGADDHRFTNLVGSGSSDKPSDGTYNITWAFCWWDEGCKERMTRCRNCEQHFLNCYWNSSVANYYVGPENAKCYFEGCTFEGKANSSSKIWKSYGGTNSCKFVNCSGNLPSNSGSVSAPSYSYDQMGAAAAKNMVINSSCGAGATLTVTTAGRVYSSCDGATPTLYTVTWNATANGGSCSTTSTQVASGDVIGTLPTATKSGYTFNGWYTAATGGTKISASTVVTGNITYYAQFTESQGGGGESGTGTWWNISDDDFNSLGTITTETVVRNLHLVATEANPLIVEANSKSIDGYNFTHRLKLGGTGNASYRNLWFTVTGNCTVDIYLMSGKSGETRNLNVATGSFGNIAQTLSAGDGTAITKVTYEYTGGATTIYLYSASSGINIYGVKLTYSGGGDAPTPTTYTLTYDENGGSGTMAEQTVNSGGSVTIAANGFTAPAGYTFKEWNSHPHGSGTKYTIGQSVTLTANLTIYAVWQPNTYTVTLNAAGGTGGTTSVTATYDAAMPNITIPTRDGYTFLGYFSEQNGGGTQYYDANGSSTNSWTTASGGTLYANWEVGSVTPVGDSDLHFWFFYADDATTNGVSNDATVFSNMVASGSQMAGSITIDGHSYSVTRRTGDNQIFGSFTIPSGKEAIFYALAVSSGGGDRQINLVSGGTTVEELAVAGGSDSYKRLESGTLAAGTYSIEREGSSNVRLAVIVLRIVDAGSTPQPTTYTVTWNANGGTCATATSTIQENEAVGTLPEPTREGYTFDGWWTAAEGGTAVTSATIITADITFFAHWTENQGGGSESVIFHWRWAGDGTSPANGSTLTTISGTMTLQTSDASKSASTESAAYAASVPADLKSLGSKGVKLGANALYFVIEPISTAEGFKRGDTLYICGYNPVKISSTSEHSGDITDSIQTGTSKADYQSNYLILNKNASALYLMRARGTGTGFTGIKVVRPANAPTYYTVTFKDNFGNTLKTEEVESGSAATAPTVPTIDCYTPGDWDVPFNNVTSDLVVTVTYTVDKHTVTLHYEATQGSVTIQ